LAELLAELEGERVALNVNGLNPILARDLDDEGLLIMQMGMMVGGFGHEPKRRTEN
jgi:hypothetical protein